MRTGRPRYTQEYFLKKVHERHGDRYDYSLSIYKSGHEKVKIICRVHGIFEQDATSHINGHNCPYCVKANYGKYKRPDPPPIKRCGFCGNYFPRNNEHFPSNKHNKDGLSNRCKKCNYICTKEWIKTHKDKRHEYSKRQSEKDKLSGVVYIRNKKRREIPHNRICDNLRNRVWDILNRGETITPKYFKFKEYVGCSPYFLRNYLESKFQDGMTWDNYGLHGWHIDHIIPCSAFDLTDPEQQRQCFHYTNLQPLWAYENLSKGARIMS